MRTNKPTHLIARAGSYQVENEVYFYHNLDEAVYAKDWLEAESAEHWIVAEILDETNWLMRCLFWLVRKAADGS